METIVIPKIKIEKQKGLVILPLTEYRKLAERTVPIYYLNGKAAEKIDRLVIEGLKEHRAGKTKKIQSLADLE